jgi:hypothetical protein
MLPEAELARLDVAAVNLACATGLPGAERIDVEGCLCTLGYWAGCVGQYTARYLPRFYANPARYENSEAYYRTMALIVVLQRDLGVRYNPAKIPEDVPFDTDDTFLHGVIHGPGGTCATMPVVYAAVGRRLGYPIKLVKVKGHLLARWDDPQGERFNIEGTNRGLNCHPDEFYRTGRFAVPPEVEESCYFLRSQTPRMELAGFLAQRGCCLYDLGRYKEAAESFIWASALVPENKLHQRSVLDVLDKWADKLDALQSPDFPRFKVFFPPQRRYPPPLPVEVERQLMFYEKVEECLTDPKYDREWWEPLRRCKGARPANVPTMVEMRAAR